MKKHQLASRIRKLENKRQATTGPVINIDWRSTTDPEFEPKPGQTWITWEADDRIVSRRLNLDGTITEW